ncbi:MAG: protein prkA [Bacillota bacterium]
MKLLEGLRKAQEKEQRLKWEGTFFEYLQLVQENPQITRLAQARIYDMVISHGIDEKVEGTRIFKFFISDLFGLEDTLEQLVEEYLHAAARGLESRHRILVLMGPVGSGKSTIVNLLKRGMELYTKTQEGALYAIKGCPMYEEPLHLVPEELRQSIQKQYGVHIEGSLCPWCRLMVQQNYNGRIEDVPVVRIVLSEAERRGIGTFSPSDPKSQDISELTGSIDFSTICKYGAESDPRAYRFDGELNKANRGLMEFQEIFKFDERFLYHLLSLSQEGCFKVGKYALISADEMVIGHTNEVEYKNFISNPKNEALKSRLFVIPVPYTLKVSEEVKIYEKLIRQSHIDLHVAPHTLWVVAVFSILTRLKPSLKQGVTLIKKVKLYNGEYVEGFSQSDVKELKSEFPHEGMEGIDPRFVVNVISTVLAAHELQCATGLDMLSGLKKALLKHPGLDKEQVEKYLDLLWIAWQAYDELIKKQLQSAFTPAYEGIAHSLFKNYLNNIMKYYEVEPSYQGETDPVDEGLMRSIEEHMGVSENAKGFFREELYLKYSSLIRDGKYPDFESAGRLKEAIEQNLFNNFKQIIRVRLSSYDVGQDYNNHAANIKDILMTKFDYCEICSAKILDYAVGLLSG